jgi:hypothetical protein
MSHAIGKMMKNTLTLSEVGRVIVEAVTSDNPEFRHIAGKRCSRGYRVKGEYDGCRI